jgi:hypothetical protein
MIDFSPKVLELRSQIEAFMDEHIYPNEQRFYREAEELGPWSVYPVSLQLLGTRHRQHGGARPLWHTRAAGALAKAAARWRDPLVLCDDRACGGFERRHQYRVIDPARRR